MEREIVSSHSSAIISILFVEPNIHEHEREDYVRAISSGFSCLITAPNAEDALISSRNMDFDIVVSAIDLDGMDGFELISLIKLRNPKCISVLISSKEIDGNMHKATQCGADNYIVEPFSVEYMQQVITELAEKSCAAKYYGDDRRAHGEILDFY